MEVRGQRRDRTKECKSRCDNAQDLCTTEKRIGFSKLTWWRCDMVDSEKRRRAVTKTGLDREIEE